MVSRKLISILKQETNRRCLDPSTNCVRKTILNIWLHYLTKKKLKLRECIQVCFNKMTKKFLNVSQSDFSGKFLKLLQKLQSERLENSLLNIIYYIIYKSRYFSRNSVKEYTKYTKMIFDRILSEIMFTQNSFRSFGTTYGFGLQSQK